MVEIIKNNSENNKERDNKNYLIAKQLIDVHDLENILQKSWNILPLKLILSSGEYEHISFKVVGENKTIFCKLTKGIEPEKYQLQSQFATAVKNASISVPELLKTDNNEACVEIGGFLLSAQQYIQGETFSCVSIENVKQIAAVQAVMHDASFNLLFSSDCLVWEKSLENRINTFFKFNKDVPDSLQTLYSTIADFIKDLEPFNLNDNKTSEFALCHFDLHPFNVTWQDNQPTVIDFDDMYFGRVIDDFAYAAWQWSFKVSPSVHTATQQQLNLFNSYYKAYMHHRANKEYLTFESIEKALDLACARILIYLLFRSLEVEDSDFDIDEINRLITWTQSIKSGLSL